MMTYPPSPTAPAPQLAPLPLVTEALVSADRPRLTNRLVSAGRPQLTNPLVSAGRPQVMNSLVSAGRPQLTNPLASARLMQLATAFAVIAVLAPRPASAQADSSDAEAPATTSTAQPSDASTTATDESSATSSAAPSTGSTSSAPVTATIPATEAQPAASSAAEATVARFDVRAPHRLVIDLDAFGDVEMIRRDGPDLQQFRLGRAELGTSIGLGPAWHADLRLESIRSAADGGALGVDGDSLVVRLKRAQIAGELELSGVTLGVAGGLVADPWIAAVETDYQIRPLSASASERLLGWPTSDLAAVGRIGYGPARLSVSIGNGEGLRYPERNDGQTTTAVLEVVPFAKRWRDEPMRVRLAVVGRDGSLGPANVRDHRVGGAATFSSAVGVAGVEVVRAWGIGTMGDLEGLALASWIEARPIERFAAVARVSTIGFLGVGTGRQTSTGGALAFDAWRAGRNPRGAGGGAAGAGGDARDATAGRAPDTRGGNVRVWLAVDRTTASDGAMPLAGADAGDATTVMLILSALAPVVID